MENLKNNNYYGHGISWRRGNILGKGSFGTVFLATPFSRTSCFPEVMAIKSAEVSKSASIQMEKQILDDLNDCPHIISCLGEETSFGDNGTLIYNMLLEYCSGGTLSDRIRNFNNGRGLCESEVKYYTKSLVTGLKYIHETGYIHRDLKPDNILLVSNYEEDKETSAPNKFSLRISDFGLAKKAPQQGLRMDKKRKAEGEYLKGTVMYLSPEAVKNCTQERPSDIWALGCIVLQMLTGQNPWDSTDSDIFKTIGYSRKLPKIPRKFSQESKDFLRKCLVRNPKNRWTAEMLLDHPFLNDINNATEIQETQEEEPRKRQKCHNTTTTIDLNFPPVQNYYNFL